MEFKEIGHVVLKCPRCQQPRHLAIEAVCRPFAGPDTKTWKAMMGGQQVGEVHLAVRQRPGHRSPLRDAFNARRAAACQGQAALTWVRSEGIDNMMTEDEHARREETLRRSQENPMPRELRRRVSELIEPQTMNAGIDHGEVMTCIEIAYLEIRDA